MILIRTKGITKAYPGKSVIKQSLQRRLPRMISRTVLVSVCSTSLSQLLLQLFAG